MKRLNSIASQALRHGCNYYGLVDPLNENGEFVLLFKDFEKSLKFCGWLERNGFQFHFKFKREFSNVYVKFTLPFFVKKKTLFKSYKLFLKNYSSVCSFGFPYVHPNKQKPAPKPDLSYLAYLSNDDLYFLKRAQEHAAERAAKSEMAWENINRM